MPRFITGDELGNIKSLRYSVGVTGDGQVELKTIVAGAILDGRPNAVQALAVVSGKVAAGHADGSIRAFSLSEDHLETLLEEKEPRFTPEQRFVGLQITNRGIYSCTSSGALKITTVQNQEETCPTQLELASLPSRLRDWHLSSDEETFCYGGDEVDLSVWNTARAFAPPPEDRSATSSKKRKRGGDLFPGEIWRAKNVPNDYLGLRQPVRITSLTYLSPSASTSHHHILTGTQLGDVRRYDTRAARRPTADWKGIGKIGGVKVVEKGLEEHEAFVADGGGNLFSLDLRTGRVIHGYKGISGAVNSIAPAPSILASTALDRFTRIHSTHPPPAPGAQLERKGKVLDKVFMKSIPTVVRWDQDTPATSGSEDRVADSEDDDIWDALKHIK